MRLSRSVLVGSAILALAIAGCSSTAGPLSPEPASKLSPGTGIPPTQTRTLDGPMTLIEASPGAWQVVDFVRNGQPLGQVLASVGTDIPKEGVTLHVFAEIFDSQIWELVISVNHGTNTPLALGKGSV